VQYHDMINLNRFHFYSTLYWKFVPQNCLRMIVQSAIFCKIM